MTKLIFIYRMVGSKNDDLTIDVKEYEREILETIQILEQEKFNSKK